jgi:hypothetical protein
VVAVTVSASTRLHAVARPRSRGGVGRWLTVSAWAMVPLWPLALGLGVRAGVTVATLLGVHSGRQMPAAARVVVDGVGLLVLVGPQLTGIVLAILATRRRRAVAAWAALTVNLVVLGMPWFVMAGGGNVVNVTGIATVSGLAAAAARLP